MKITGIDVFSVPLRIKDGPYVMAGMEIHELDSTLVRVTADNGLAGWGETCPLGPVYQEAHALGARAALAELSPAVIGCDPTHLGVLHERMGKALRGHNYAKAALDIACHDLSAQHFGVPVCDLLGGALVDAVPSYVVLQGDAAKDVLARAQDLKAAGWTRFQYKAGIVPLRTEAETLRALWTAMPEIFPLKIDANRGLLMRDTILLSGWLSDVPLIFEQPTETMAEILALKGRLNHPLYADEVTTDVGTVLELAANGAADGFGLKLTRFGGLRPTAQVRDICAARNLPHTCDDSFGGEVITAACVHLGATVRPDLLDGVWTALPYLDAPLAPGRDLLPRDGMLPVPKSPGLGVTPDTDRLPSPVASYG